MKLKAILRKIIFLLLILFIIAPTFIAVENKSILALNNIEDSDSTDENTQDIYHTVTFHMGDDTWNLEIEDGEICPEPKLPDIPEGMNAFWGWFELDDLDQEPDMNDYFLFTTPIKNDMDLYAIFSDKYVVHFENGTGMIIKTMVIKPGEKIDRSMSPVDFLIDENLLFSGNWRVKLPNGTSDVNLYDFGLEVKEDFTLVPDFVNGYLIQFFTSGNAIEAQPLREGDTVKKPDDPIRTGYKFLYWSSEKDGLDDEGRVLRYDFNVPVESSFTIYAIWQPLTVNYKIVYWLEKENIPLDDFDEKSEKDNTENYAFAYYENKQALAGTEVDVELDNAGMPLNATSSQKELLMLMTSINSAGPYSKFYRSIKTTVNGDGTSIVNVYYIRKIYTLVFDWSEYNTKITTVKLPNSGTHNKSKYTYTIKGKVGLNLQDQFPIIIDENGNQNFIIEKQNNIEYVIQGWGPWKISNMHSLTFQHLTAGSNASATSYDVSTATAVYGAKWIKRSEVNLTKYYIFVESLDQSSNSAQIPIENGSSNVVDRILVKSLKLFDGSIVKINDGVQNFDLRLASHYYWATNKDRQIANTIAGFTYYSKEITGLDANCYQWDGSKFYQLKRTGNENHPKRYFFYKRDSYKLTFETFGQGEIDEIPDIKFGRSLENFEPNESELQLEDTNLEFKGWYLDSDCTIEFDFNTATMPSGDLNLFAGFKLKDYKVNFRDKHNGDIVLSEDVIEGDTVSDPEKYIYDMNYKGRGIFKGWFWLLSGQLVQYMWENTIKNDTEIFAVWLPAQFHTLEYDLDGGVGVKVPIDKNKYTVTSSARVATLESIPYKYEANVKSIFGGWQEAESGNIYYPGTIFNIQDDTKLIARYMPLPQYSITYYRNRSARDNVFTLKTFNEGDKIIFPTDTYLSYKHTDHEFLGWSTNSNAKYPEKKAGEAIIASEDITLYAVWKPKVKEEIEDEFDDEINEEIIEEETIEEEWEFEEESEDSISLPKTGGDSMVLISLRVVYIITSSLAITILIFLVKNYIQKYL